MNQDNFFNVPTKKIKTAQGVIDLPIFYQDYSYAHFFFWTDYDKTAAKLANTIFTPCRFFNGKAGVLLNFFQYRKSAIGPYNEVGLSIACHPRSMKKAGPYAIQLLKDARSWTMGAYVINLPVTTELANAGGREIWSYPKFVTALTVDLKGRDFTGIVSDPDTIAKEPICSLEGRMGLFGPGITMTKASFISHTMHKGKGLSVLTEADARFKINIGFSGRVQVNEKSSHAMARNLIDLGLKDRKPFIVMHCESARMILHEGVPIS